MKGLEAGVDWKGWKGRWKCTSVGRVERDAGSVRQLEGLDPDVDWKGWKRRQLEGTLEATLIGSGCQLEGLEATSSGRELEGMDPTLLLEGDWKERQLEGDWKGWIRTSLLDGDWKGRCC